MNFILNPVACVHHAVKTALQRLLLYHVDMQTEMDQENDLFIYL